MKAWGDQPFLGRGGKEKHKKIVLYMDKEESRLLFDPPKGREGCAKILRLSKSGQQC